MSPMIFINLPVGDLAQSITFYRALGWTQNHQFSDNTAACMGWSEAIHTMLLTYEKWRSFTHRRLPNAHETAQVLLGLSVAERHLVDAMVKAAEDYGGLADPNGAVDTPFMYSRSLADPDGHIWEVMWMDPDTALQPPDA